MPPAAPALAPSIRGVATGAEVVRALRTLEEATTDALPKPRAASASALSEHRRDPMKSAICLTSTSRPGIAAAIATSITAESVVALLRSEAPPSLEVERASSACSIWLMAQAAVRLGVGSGSSTSSRSMCASAEPSVDSCSTCEEPWGGTSAAGDSVSRWTGRLQATTGGCGAAAAADVEANDDAAVAAADDEAEEDVIDDDEASPDCR